MKESPDPTYAPSDAAPRMSRGRRSALAVAGASALAGAIMTLAAVGTSNAAGADPNDNQKYFVCKYVGTPGVDEHLQTGNNPISVSGSAINETPVVVGTTFADGQGRSLVIAVDNTGNGGGQNGEPAPACPATPPGGGSSTPPPPPSSSSSLASSSASGESSSIVVPPPATTAVVSGTVTEIVTESEAAAPQQAQGPIPAGVNAGLHTTDSNAGLKAWGILLMLLGGAAGLVFGLRPSRGRAH